MKSDGMGSLPTGSKSAGRRRGVSGLLFTAVVLAALSGPGPSYGQETDTPPIDSTIVAGLTSDTMPSVADRARSMLGTLRSTADSIEVLEAVRLSDPDLDRAYLRLLALEQVGVMQLALRSLAHLMSQVSPDSLPADSVRAFFCTPIWARISTASTTLSSRRSRTSSS